MYRASLHHLINQYMVLLFIIDGIYLSLYGAWGIAAAVIPAGVTIALVGSMVFHLWSPGYEGGHISGFGHEGREDGS
ncbi:hypothetical protein BTUL_0042g00230 [Botrytis tulipae]|uniref:Uncharacterized protein n=1 Tax=Botrytis tulipae TaxID=87230 RepID=A0A4Z1EXR9_9HELO|nr:hypothetical protein BTUL_0042g00230 [Botrytis tulipae]